MDDEFDGPVLNGWRVIDLEGELFLLGQVSGHPYLGEGNWIITSDIVETDKQMRWAKTINRYYRLKNPWPLKQDLPEGAVELMTLEMWRRMEPTGGVALATVLARAQHLAESICRGRGDS